MDRSRGTGWRFAALTLAVLLVVLVTSTSPQLRSVYSLSTVRLQMAGRIGPACCESFDRVSTLNYCTRPQAASFREPGFNWPECKVRVR